VFLEQHLSIIDKIAVISAEQMHQSVAGSHCLGDRIQYLSATLQLHDARRKRFMYNQRFPLSAPTES